MIYISLTRIQTEAFLQNTNSIFQHHLLHAPKIKQYCDAHWRTIALSNCKYNTVIGYKQLSLLVRILQLDQIWPYTEKDDRHIDYTRIHLC